MKYDDIIRELERIKRKNELTYKTMAEKANVGVNILRTTLKGYDVRIKHFEKIANTFGIDVNLKKTRYEVFQAINNSDLTLEEIIEQSGLSEDIIGRFLSGGNTNVYNLLDLLEQFNLEF